MVISPSPRRRGGVHMKRASSIDADGYTTDSGNNSVHLFLLVSRAFWVRFECVVM